MKDDNARAGDRIVYGVAGGSISLAGCTLMAYLGLYSTAELVIIWCATTIGTALFGPSFVRWFRERE